MLSVGLQMSELSLKLCQIRWETQESGDAATRKQQQQQEQRRQPHDRTQRKKSHWLHHQQTSSVLSIIEFLHHGVSVVASDLSFPRSLTGLLPSLSLSLSFSPSAQTVDVFVTRARTGRDGCSCIRIHHGLSPHTHSPNQLGLVMLESRNRHDIG
jgi:hypothetical protein